MGASAKIFTAAVDRIEERIAILVPGDDDSRKIIIPLFLMPEGVKESDIVRICVEIDEEETAAIKQQVAEKLHALTNRKE